MNGRPVDVDPDGLQEPLLDFLRACGLTGAKEGCAEGECGACAVAFVVDEGGSSAYRVVNSCLVPLGAAAGREVWTVEGLAEHGTLADAQLALAAAGGSQCGYCTPGFVVSLFAEQYRRDRAGPCDSAALFGNLCRCTGYRPIRDAAAALGPPPPGRLLDRLSRPPRPLVPIDAGGFARPASVEEAVAILASTPGATLVAGSTDLGVESQLHGARWTRLVSLDAVDELRRFTETLDEVRIGAALPLADLRRHWTTAPAVVDEWLALFGSPPIRHRATLGGNLATASPIGDGAPLLLALDASIELAGLDGRRRVPLDAFFTGYRKTVRGRDEIITTIVVPKPLPALVRFYKVARRRVDDISTVAAAMSLDRDATGRVSRARFAFGGVAATPLRVDEAERAALDQPWTMDAVERVQRALDRTLTPMSDHRGSKEYRLEVSRSLVERFWWEQRP